MSLTGKTPTNLLQQMLDAAGKAAGAQWPSVSADLKSYAQDLIQDSAQTASDLAAHNITEAEAKVQLDGIADATAMLANYATQSLKIAAQNAANAAEGVLWDAIKAAVP